MVFFFFFKCEYKFGPLALLGGVNWHKGTGGQLGFMNFKKEHIFDLAVPLLSVS